MRKAQRARLLLSVRSFALARTVKMATFELQLLKR